MSLVGKKAPVFKSGAVINGEEIVEEFSLEQYIGQKDVMFFFYPKDFTFVCPTEILAFQEKLAEFEKRGVAVIGASTDTEETHLAWLLTPQEEGGIEGVTYPLVADASKTIANNYGVLAGDWNYNEEGELIFEGTPVAYRGTFLIDKEGIVRHETINDLPLGRNIDEMLRVVDAWQHVEKFGEVCPANWEEGKEAMEESRESVSSYLAKNKK
jgi:peroxiredoxin (alkyl hydroperoxide reductase subunit C)